MNSTCAKIFSKKVNVADAKIIPNIPNDENPQSDKTRHYNRLIKAIAQTLLPYRVAEELERCDAVPEIICRRLKVTQALPHVSN